MTIDYSRFDAIDTDTSSSSSSSRAQRRATTRTTTGKEEEEEDELARRMMKATTRAKDDDDDDENVTTPSPRATNETDRFRFGECARVPCGSHRRTNNLLFLVSDFESIEFARYAKAFNLPQTEIWVVPLRSSDDRKKSASEAITEKEDANANAKRVCELALVAADALEFDLETQIHFLAYGREASRTCAEACAIFGEMFEGVGGAFMIHDDETRVDAKWFESASLSSAMEHRQDFFIDRKFCTIEKKNKMDDKVAGFASERKKTRMTFLKYSTAAKKEDVVSSLAENQSFRNCEIFHHESTRTPLESEKVKNCLIANETEARMLFSHLGKTLKQTPDDPDLIDLTRRPGEEKSYAYDVSSHPRRNLVRKTGDLSDVFEAMFVRQV